MTRPIKYWRHIKTGNIYVRLMEVINSTNGENDGQLMIVYESRANEKFVREKNEFLEKFEPID